MSADQITPERIAELRERAATGGPDNAWRRSDYLAVLDALTTSRAEVASLRFQLQDKANGYALAKDGWVSEQDVSAELRAEVQRLTEEAERLRAELDQCDRPEFPVKMSPDGVARLRVSQYWIERAGGQTFVWVDADEVRRKLPLTEEARRSDAGRVEVPEFDANRLDLEGSWDSNALRTFLAGARAGHNALASRLSPSPQPATGAALTCDTCESREGCPKRGTPCMYHVSHSDPQPSADVVVVRTDKASFDRAALKMMTAYKMLRRESPRKPHADIGWMEDLLSAGLDALRSSTNHDAQDAGEGR